MNMPQASNTARHLAPLCAVQFLSVFKNTLFAAFLVFYLAAVQDTVFSLSFDLLCMTLFAALMKLLFFFPAGVLADRLPKRYVLILTAFADLLICSGTVFCLSDFGDRGLIPAGLLFFTHTFYSPAFYGTLPELFGEEKLPEANGAVSLRSFAGLIAGLAAAWLIPSQEMMLVFVLLAGLAAFLLSFRIPFTVSAPPPSPVWHEFLSAWRELTKRPSLLLAGLGENFFLAVGLFLPFLILLCQYELGGGRTTLFTSVFLLLLPLLSFPAGGWLAGRLSRGKIEPGLVPFGALGVALSLFFGTRFYGPLFSFHVEISYFSGSILIPAGATFFLILGGICGGLFVFPLRTYLQQRLRRNTRGMSLAIQNGEFFFFAGLLMYFLVKSQGGTLSEIMGDCACIGNMLPAVTLLTLLGWITFFVTLFTMWALPEFALRFLIISLSNTVYKLRVTGAEHIPQQGAALLVANHVSGIDNILLSACTSRKIRFLMQEELFKRHLLLRILARLTGFITAPSGGKGLLKMVEDVRAALRAGEIVCVYPEGAQTRNSITGRFRGGFLKLLPPDLPDIPVIPVHIGGMWGSRFSYYREIADARIPLRMANRAEITFGAPVTRAALTPFSIRQKIGELSADAMTSGIRPAECPLHTRFFRNAKYHPFRPVFRDSGGAVLTAGRAFLTALAASRRLRKLLAKNEEHAGILLPNGISHAAAMLAVLYADRVACPLNHTAPLDVLAATIRHAGIRHIITSREFAEKVTQLPSAVSLIYTEDLLQPLSAWKYALFLPFLMLMPSRELMNLVSPLTGNDVSAAATILFSSGSTGIPKGVVLSHHNINSDMYALLDLLGIKPETDGILGNLPLFHSFGMTTCFWIPAATACPVTYLPSPLEAALAGTVIERDRLTILYATPSFLQVYLRKCTKEQLVSLRLVVTGAEKLRADIAERLKEMTDGRLTVTEAYGCTELSPVVTVNVPSDQKYLGMETGKADSIGPAIEYTAAKVVDPITFEELPPDSEGLLFVKGPMVMQGYLNDPANTAKAVSAGYYNTGDIVTMDKNGYISICGRLSRFSKIAGEMIPHEMVERIINELCGTAERCVAVCSIPDPKKGEALLVLYLPEMPFTPEEIVEQLRERSISNLWIPKAVNFAPVDHLPLLGSGKLDLSALKKIADRIALQRQGEK